MSYDLAYTQRATRDIEKMDPKIKERIGKVLLRCKEEPLSYAENLSDSKLGSYRFRIGDYRMIFDIEENEIVVFENRTSKRDLQKNL